MTLHIALLCVATSAVAYASWRVAAGLGLRGAVETVVAALVLACAAVVGISLLVGAAIGRYQPWPLTMAALLFAVLAVAWTLRALPRRRARRARANLRRTAADAVRGLRRHPLIAVLGLLVLTQYVWRLAIGVMLPPMDWDGLSYHLIGPDTWILDGRIGRVDQVLWADVYPQNIELVTAWPGVFLRTLQYGAAAQYPLYLLGGLAVAGLARRVGAHRYQAVTLALVYLAIPAAFVQASTTYVDGSSAALALSAIYLVTGVHGSVVAGISPVRAVLLCSALSGTALGLAAGAKPSNLIFVPIVLAAALIQATRVSDIQAQSIGQIAQRPVLAVAIVMLAPLSALGAFWYLRTYINYGNPFHPFTMMGFTGSGTVKDVIIRGNRPPELLDLPFGEVGSLVRSWAADFRPHLHQYDIRLGGFGLPWIVLVLPAAVVAIGTYLRRRRRTGPVVLLTLAAVTCFVASPAPWWPRYVLPAMGICCGLAAVTLSRIRRRATQAALQIAVVGLVATSMWWATNPTYVCQKGVCDQRTLSVSQAAELMRRPDRADLVWPWFEYQFLDTLPQGTTIAVTRDSANPFTHPFVGQDLRHRLSTVAAQPNVDGLASAMTAASARYVILSVRDDTAPLAHAASRDQRFKLLTTPEQRVSGADVFEFGRFPEVCTDPTARLSLRVAGRTKTTVTLTTALQDTCGQPLAGKEVNLWNGTSTRPLWKQDKIAQTAVTGPDGRASFTVPAPTRTNRYFVRYNGTDYVPAAASAPLHLHPVNAEPTLRTNAS